MEEFRHKLHEYTLFWSIICDLLELVIAVIVSIAIIGSIFSLLPGLTELLHSGHAVAGFSEYLEELFVCVIGIEFLKMLCHPNSDNVLETLIFLVARHMIINSSSPKENLVSVCTIVLLVMIRRIMKHDKEHEIILPFMKEPKNPPVHPEEVTAPRPVVPGKDYDEDA